MVEERKAAQEEQEWSSRRTGEVISR